MSGSSEAIAGTLAQLTDLFPMWREEDDVRPPHLRRILAALERRAAGPVSVRRERVIGVIMLMTAMTADRARAGTVPSARAGARAAAPVTVSASTTPHRPA